MDYLTVLSTLRVQLFVGASPTLPPGLGPVTMSLLALIRDDTFCAFFLLDRILEVAGAKHLSYASLERSAETRALAQAAEVLVWQEICRAKTFARALGTFFEGHDRINERELAALASSHGIGLATNEHREHRTSEHRRHDVDSVRAPRSLPAVAPVLV
ncbi:hypothetical protein A1Q1_01489 [Trichosporon asahii var. asahii CBS 2479]|jgi:hypothetical protein|uniref:Uncharacterized protein n=1 Tax=Trichosporon asahii var. asahii (strain ATCC 90039 / CBS 2479 / JCM 2466 / KCTC 7840 / NBRC 103889/ NCYC 2677 / UAMH 7654) TaxID=1186058 RepID=J6EXL0_TRIAS|nr:hypothetical protein A1Q1_01489 [Trichosporon asahii var. asahii CBS 2479]EJT49394.1 hypothetical protein A1Q1_01489 [Trichosporon asahii var. asahii CBS 2479]